MEAIGEWKLVWRKQRNQWVAREKGGKRRQIALKTDNEEQAKMLLKQKLGAEVLPEENRQHHRDGEGTPQSCGPGDGRALCPSFHLPLRL